MRSTGDEQRELAVAQRVEDLAFVVARAHAVAIGHEPQPREVVAVLEQRLHGASHAAQRHPGVEQ